MSKSHCLKDNLIDWLRSTGVWKRIQLKGVAQKMKRNKVLTKFCKEYEKNDCILFWILSLSFLSKWGVPAGFRVSLMNFTSCLNKKHISILISRSPTLFFFWKSPIFFTSCIIFIMGKRTKRCPKNCEKHRFILKPVHYSAVFSRELEASYCPSHPNHPSIMPKFNKDKKHYTIGFYLPADHVTKVPTQ